VPLQICHSLHFDDPRIYIPAVKIFLCFLSISLIYFSYIVGRNIASEEAGRLASVFSAFWYELIYFAHKPNPESLSTYLLIAALACAVVKANQGTSILFGFLCALSVALRLQYLPVAVVLTVFVCFSWRRNLLIAAAIGFFTTILIVGYVDYETWGSFFSSYYRNYLFNQVYGVNQVFGIQEPYHLLTGFIIASAGIFPLAVILSLRNKKIWLLLSCLLFIILPHSLIPHKEYRFIFATVPLLLIITAVAISTISRYISEYIYGFKKATLAFTAFIFLLSAEGAFFSLPFQEQIYSPAKLMHNSIFGRQAALEAYLFLFQEPDLVSIFNTFSPWYEQGGYYYLHRDIPIYFPEHLESVSKNQLGLYVSHIVCSTEDDRIPGFESIARFGDLEIRKQSNPPNQFKSLNIDTKNVFQIGVDDRFTPPASRIH
jgi:hypothetical protein